ncbi:hypothetical protein T08_2720 [Trichinella sp. T8]|nr:hypothetical protein T08_2720 [Trichinella sp. T8]
MTGCGIWPACCQHPALDPSRYVAALSLNDRFHLYPQRAYYFWYSLRSVLWCIYLKARHIHNSHRNNRSPRTEDIMRLAYTSSEMNAMAQSYFNQWMLNTV